MANRTSSDCMLLLPAHHCGITASGKDISSHVRNSDVLGGSYGYNFKIFAQVTLGLNRADDARLLLRNGKASDS